MAASGNTKKRYAQGKKKNKKTAEAQEQALDEKELDRFAGSSDEEEGDLAEKKDFDAEQVVVFDDDDQSEDDNEKSKPKPKKKVKKEKPKPKAKKTKNENDDNDNDGIMADKEEGASSDGDDNSNMYSNEDDDFEEYEKEQRNKHGPAGMADAMAKILGPTATASTSTANSSAVLSKTTTPLQRQLQQEKQAAKELKDKRRSNNGPLEDPLPALHIPLSVATSLTLIVNNNKSSVATELEQERLHRRVATRGVVALFNAVAQHQQAKKNDDPSGGSAGVTSGTSNTSKNVKKLTKHGFLDMIKTAAVATTAGDGKAKDKATTKANNSSGSGSKWDAMQEDYLLNPKKNWDEEEESSDEENIDTERPDIEDMKDEDSEEEDAKNSSSKDNKKKGKPERGHSKGHKGKKRRTQ